MTISNSQTRTQSRSESLPNRQTKTIKHRLPKRKVEEVWKPLSIKSCEILEETLNQSIKSSITSESETQSIQRIQRRAQTLTKKMRVPIGVYSGIKLNSEGQVEMISLEDLMKKNKELEVLIDRKERERNPKSKG
ncbi:uncharacterized protein MELLADRAFT_113559 [Melampsora larici-populina 98AG31]|uniref:Uncharacterized protein n=1 Tax=Melampsora larici-populina (strain 98AG31 / pathotype 3-4-7) TaxID=747676 RepID=F4SAA6_MELLP|nr:uncharacterized protein MELLADRAFT_113559 [Melampsora larici-populina 98AG31]EGF98438.1 hypothetical protein MELLADRAFT_113559 [Melampsora larici-populina 98AG31]